MSKITVINNCVFYFGCGVLIPPPHKYATELNLGLNFDFQPQNVEDVW